MMRYLAPIGAAAIIIYLVMKPGPMVYSYNEMARATAKCEGNITLVEIESCAIPHLKEWRRTAPDDAPRGSLP